MPAGREVHVDDLGQRLADERQEDALAGQAEIVVLLRRHADDRREVDRVLAPRHAGHVEDREVVGQRVEARVIAERPLAATLAGLDVALDHDLRVRRHLEVDRDGLDEVHARAPEEAREQQLVEPLGHRRGRGVGHRRVRPDRHRHLEPPAEPLGHAVVLRAALVPLPVHARRAAVEHLHAVHADVAHARLGVLRDHEREGDEPAAVLRPAAQHRQLVERGVAPDHLLAGRVLHDARHQVAQPPHHRQHLHRVEEARRHLRRHQLVDLAGDLVERGHAEGEAHPLHRAEDVGRHRHVEPGGPLEEERRPAARRLGHAVGHGRDLQVGAHLLADARQLAFLIEHGEESVQIFVHEIP